MKLPKSFTTVTTLSKMIALVIFILFPIFGFYLGYKYHELSNPIKTQYLTQTLIKYVPYEETSGDIFKRCGDFPVLPKSSFGSTVIRVSGPFWSHDCRNIAWSNYYFRIGRESNDQQITTNLKNTPTSSNIPEDSGVYIYNDSSRNITKIYTPKDITETYSLSGWLTKNKLSISISGESYEYSLVTNKLNKID